METIAVWQCDSVVQFCVCTKNQKTCNVLFTLTSKIMTSNLWQNKWFHMCVWAKLCASIYIFVLITGIVWTLYKIEFWVFLFIWLVIWDGISSNRLHNVSARSCLKGVATHQFPPPPPTPIQIPQAQHHSAAMLYTMIIIQPEITCYMELLEHLTLFRTLATHWKQLPDGPQLFPLGKVSSRNKCANH